MSYIPTDIVYEEVYNVRNAMAVIGIISILLLALLIGRVVYVVIRPVKELTSVIEAMTEGDFKKVSAALDGILTVIRAA